jgi:hypothetical protein
LTALKLGQIDSGLGTTPAHILWRSVIWRAALPPLSEWLLSSRMSRMAGNRSRLAGKSKRDPVVRPHEPRHVAADRLWELPRSATQGARAGETPQPVVRPCRPLSRLEGGRERAADAHENRPRPGRRRRASARSTILSHRGMRSAIPHKWGLCAEAQRDGAAATPRPGLNESAPRRA